MKFLAPLFSPLFILICGCTPRPHAPESKDGAVIAKVSDTVITDNMLLERIAAIEKTYPRSYLTHIQKKNLLTEMMNTELLYQEALALGLDKKYEFKSRLADLYVREIAEAARNKITDADLRQYFEENKEGIEQVSARHILLSTKETKSPKEKAELKEKLEGYRKELLKEPQHFAEYARKYSQDSSRNSGGELGFFTRAMMVPPFSKAAFKLKNVNDISDVVETQYGFHLIQLVGDRRGLEPSKDLIREQLLRKTQRERLDQALETLKKGKAFQVFEDELSKLSPLPKEILTDPKDLIPPGSVGHESEPK